MTRRQKVVVMSQLGQEIVHEGWLTKSPPTKRIWRARWRRRWFTLRHTGELPGQYFLEYYTDRNCRKLKGTIDLDQCEQVDAGLHYEQRKLKYPYMFDVKTPSRVYYLAAESEQDMNNWVDCICQVCGLKAYNSDDQEDSDDMKQAENMSDVHVPDTPPLSPDTISGPYIPISECFSGSVGTSSPQDFRTLLQRNLHNGDAADVLQTSATAAAAVPLTLTPKKRPSRRSEAVTEAGDDTSSDPRFYDCPRQLKPYVNQSPLQSPTDSESVFTDDESSPGPMQFDKCTTKSIQSECSGDSEPSSWSVVQRFRKLEVADQDVTTGPPPRPPKPSHLGQSRVYLNMDSPAKTGNSKTDAEVGVGGSKDSDSPDSQTESQVISDEMYDFPRSHQQPQETTGESGSKSLLQQRHCYNNAAPSAVLDGQIFRYDMDQPGSNSHLEEAGDEPASPCSQSSSSTAALYSNLSSPLLGPENTNVAPPVVNRCLKPRRKLSDSTSICSQEPSSPRTIVAPSVDRKLKPPLSYEIVTIRKIRAAPSPTPPGYPTAEEELSADRDQSLFFNANSGEISKLQYLDLDLEQDSFGGGASCSQPPRSPGPLTVYKTVDFVKTDAFNRTRQCVEAARKQCNVEP